MTDSLNLPLSKQEADALLALLIERQAQAATVANNAMALIQRIRAAQVAEAKPVLAAVPDQGSAA